MAAPTYHNDHSYSGSRYERIGSSGKFFSAEVVAAGNTGSAGGAFMLGASAAAAATKIFTDGGGIINGDEFLVKTMYEIGVSKIHASGGKVYIFKKQQG
tara:strand:+ start:732 stop:1028 length:297 start_codon:yes stop_codon:yes gene_type:complete